MVSLGCDVLNLIAIFRDIRKTYNIQSVRLTTPISYGIMYIVYNLLEIHLNLNAFHGLTNRPANRTWEINRLLCEKPGKPIPLLLSKREMENQLLIILSSQVL